MKSSTKLKTMDVKSIDDIFSSKELERPYLLNVIIFYVEKNKDSEMSFTLNLN